MHPLDASTLAGRSCPPLDRRALRPARSHLRGLLVTVPTLALVTLGPSALAQRRRPPTASSERPVAALDASPAPLASAREPLSVSPPVDDPSPGPLDDAPIATASAPAREPPLWARLLARPVVERALRAGVEHANLAGSPARNLATRARGAGLVPQLNVRLTRGWGLSAVSLQQGFGASDRASSDDSFALDARLTLDLGRAIFAPEELRLLREDEQRNERRRLVEREVFDALLALARALASAHFNSSSLEDNQSVEIAVLRARLEAVTNRTIQQLIAGNARSE